MKHLAAKLRNLLRGRDGGTVTLTFALSFPILLTLIGILVQFALLANAQLTLDRAAQAGARSAMTSLPVNPSVDDAFRADSRMGQANVERSVRMILESLSPVSPEAEFEGPTTEARTVADALELLGATLPDRYRERYTYAERATVVTIEPIDGTGLEFSRERSPRVRLTVRYDFRITVPIVNVFIGRLDTVAGVEGRFRSLTSTVDVQLSPGREGAP